MVGRGMKGGAEGLAGMRTSHWMLVVLLFLVSFGVRWVWASYVQNPADAIHSDMAGYLSRAEALVSGRQARDWFTAFLPYGTHYLYAVEMSLLGRENYEAFALVQAMMGSACVVCAAGAAAYCIRSPVALCVVAVLSCLWYPSIAYCGYFTSEVPYSCFLYLSLLSTFRYVKSGRGALVTGLLYGIAFTMRPQIILMLVLFLVWVAVRRESLNMITPANLLVCLLPIGAILGFSAYRYHWFTGELGLISGNGLVTKLFGATDYYRCTGYLSQGDKMVAYSFSRVPLSAEDREFSFNGRLMDSHILGGEIRSVRSRQSLRNKCLRKMQNLSLLMTHRDTMWPEFQYAPRTIWRRLVFEVWYFLVPFCWFPLAIVGLVAAWRTKSLYLEIIGLHMIGMLITAYLYFGQIRYRTPYDLMFTILATVGVLSLSGLWHNAIPNDTCSICRTTAMRKARA